MPDRRTLWIWPPSAGTGDSRQRRGPVAVVLTWLWVLFGFAPSADAQPTRFEFSRPQMGSRFGIVLYAENEATARQAAEAAFARVEELNGILSDYDPQSELRRLCDQPAGTAVAVSDDLLAVLTRGQRLSAQSDGAFDVTVGPVVRLWRRARRQQALPDADLLAEARARVGHRLVRVDSRQQTVTLAKDAMRLDLGGIAKGYAVDAALEVLRARKIAIALVDGGGDIAVSGAPPDRDGWRLAIAPLDADRAVSQFLTLSDGAVATSGDAFQFVEIGGKRYSHIVDPRTGIGLSIHSSVTIVAADCTTADALATTVSVLGPEAGLKLVDETPGAAGFVVQQVADRVSTHASRRWSELKLERPGQD